MKKIVNVMEVQGEGLAKFMGEKIILLCANYFYAGVLTGINDDCVLLEEAGIVYDTGAWSAATWQDFQKLPDGKVYVMKSAIEAYCGGK